jgi:DNA-binding CsgD family transcriptional regulator
MRMSLSSRDYERMLDLAVELAGSTTPELDWPWLTAELKDALHGTLCVFVDGLQASRKAGRIQAWAPQWPALPSLDTLVSQTIGDHPLALHYAAHDDDRRPLAITEVTTKAGWRRTAAYAVLRSELSIDQQIAVPMGITRSFLICRPPGEQIAERDLAYARRVQPLLLAADKHVRCMRRWLASLTSSPTTTDPAEQAARLGVTARELAVLMLLADGLTATAIGRRLGISPRTVSKHQQNLYRKLEACDRVTAVLRAQEAGLLPAQKGAHLVDRVLP